MSFKTDFGTWADSPGPDQPVQLRSRIKHTVSLDTIGHMDGQISDDAVHLDWLVWNFTVCISTIHTFSHVWVTLSYSYPSTWRYIRNIMLTRCYLDKRLQQIWAATWKNQPSDSCARRTLKSACTSARFDQSLCCQHEETLYPWLSKCVGWRFWSDCANARVHLNLRWAHVCRKIRFLMV